MNILVHLKIANQVMKQVQIQHGIQLNPLGFLIGNVLPDLQHDRLQVEHFFVDSWPQIQAVANQISEEPTPAHRGPLTPFKSINIGMICHFIADYFCFAHSDHFEQNLLNHMLYETRMTFIPIQSIADEMASAMSDHQDMIHWQNTLPEALEHHSAQRPSMRRDIRQAIEQGVTITAQLMIQSGGFAHARGNFHRYLSTANQWRNEHH